MSLLRGSRPRPCHTIAGRGRTIQIQFLQKKPIQLAVRWCAARVSVRRLEAAHECLLTRRLGPPNRGIAWDHAVRGRCVLLPPIGNQLVEKTIVGLTIGPPPKLRAGGEPQAQVTFIGSAQRAQLTERPKSLKPLKLGADGAQPRRKECLSVLVEIVPHVNKNHNLGRGC